MPADFHFLHPLWLWALIPLMLLLWLIHRPLSGDGAAWQKVCDAHLLPYLLVSQDGHAHKLPLWLLAGGWLLAVLALADPAWDKRPQPVYQTLDARVIVLDVSRSMEAPDVKPSRLVQARFKVQDILKHSREGQTGLVVFAGAAFVVTPLTQDTRTIASLLSTLAPSIMPVQGSRPDLGLEKARELLQQTGLEYGEILLIGDDSGGQQTLETAHALRAQGFTISVLGTGTREGAPIPTADGGFVKDQRDAIVMPRLNPQAMRALAKAGGGRYATLRPDDGDLQWLLAASTPHLNTQTHPTEHHTELWLERGPWLIPVLLLLAALAFRRGWLLTVALCLGVTTISTPKVAMALGWDDLWQRQDQQAARALKAGNLEQTVKLARDPLRRGVAEYRRSHYQQAFEAFSKAQGADADYNRGNALAKLGRYKEAIAAYDKALQQAPEMDDAKFNRAAVQALLQQQKAQSAQNQQPKNPQNPLQDNPQEKPNDQNQRHNDQPDRRNTARHRQTNESSQNRNQPNHGSQDSPNKTDNHPKNASPNQNRQDFTQSGQPQENTGLQSESNNRHRSEKPTQRDSRDQTARSSARVQGNSESGSRDREGKQTQRRNLASESLTAEEQQALEQWLRRIPDDPGGLLRRKFLYQYRNQRNSSGPESPQSW